MLRSKLLLEIVRCPADGQRLELRSDRLHCACKRSFEVRAGIPVLTLADGKKGYWGIELPPGWRDEIGKHSVDPFVQHVIGATGGYMYEGLKYGMQNYPIPTFPLPDGQGRRVLDIGCNWGRWSIAAARKGWVAVGIDPHFEAVEAAYRVAEQLGVNAHFLVADARYLPFAENSFDVVYSYSVLQHFEKRDVEMVLERAAAILKPAGTVKIQMANGLGIRSFYHQARRGFRQVSDFHVRYWTPGEMTRVWGKYLDNAGTEVDGFLSVNPQLSDRRTLPWKYRMVVNASAFLRAATSVLPFLKIFADSLFAVGISRSVEKRTNRVSAV